MVVLLSPSYLYCFVCLPRKVYEEILLPAFEDHFLEAQQLLQSQESQAKILSAIPNPDIRTTIAEKWAKDPEHLERTPAEKWQDFKVTVSDHMVRFTSFIHSFIYLSHSLSL